MDGFGDGKLTIIAALVLLVLALLGASFIVAALVELVRFSGGW